MNNFLHESKPASRWLEAYPLGNGHIGAMIYGGTSKDMVKFNDDTLYSGKNEDSDAKHAAEHIDEIRTLLLEHKFDEALDLCGKYLLGDPLFVRSYQEVANLYIDDHANGEVTDYKRSLDMRTGIARASYTKRGVKIKKEYFVSADKDVAIIKMTADKPVLDVTVSLERTQDCSIKSYDNYILLNG